MPYSFILFLLISFFFIRELVVILMCDTFLKSSHEEIFYSLIQIVFCFFIIPTSVFLHVLIFVILFSIEFSSSSTILIFFIPHQKLFSEAFILKFVCFFVFIITIFFLMITTNVISQFFVETTDVVFSKILHYDAIK